VKELWWQHQNAQQAGNGDIQGWAQHDVRAGLGDVRCPVLIVKGADDFWVPLDQVEYSAELIGENAEVCVLPDIGHYPMFEDPEGLAALVDDFVKAKTNAEASHA
jgi:pimeloyl-ACP methyl ester carboxylesterase